MEIEVQFSPLYEGVPLFGEVSAFLNSHGFEFIDFVNLKRWERGKKKRGKQRSGGQLVFGDALFFRSPETFVASVKMPSVKLASYLGCLLVYHQFDMIRDTLTQVSPLQSAGLKEFLDLVSKIEVATGNKR